MQYDNFKKRLLNLPPHIAIDIIRFSDKVDFTTATHSYKQLRKQYIDDKGVL
jgi:hypothetical protein